MEQIYNINIDEMKVKNITYCVLLLIIMSLVNTSCSKMDDYKDFINKGEILYTGRIDSVLVYSGDEKVRIRGLIISDPKVCKCKIYWNNKLDSIEIPIKRTDGVDTLEVVLALPENTYNFQIYTYDESGNQSVPVYSIGRSYGNNYRSLITNRQISSAIFNDEDFMVDIEMRSIDKTLGAFATEIIYQDVNGKEQKVRVLVGDKQVTLPNFNKEYSLYYETLYLPDTLCVDTFRSVMSEHTVSYKISKKDWIATADTYEEKGQLPNGGSPYFVIDDDPKTYWHTAHTTKTTPYPHWLAFDMKDKVRVDFIELTSRSDFYKADFKNFLIEGRNDESEDWTLYGVFNLPDIIGPQRFFFPKSPIMRFLRIYQLDGGSPPHSHLAEFSVYGRKVE